MNTKRRYKTKMNTKNKVQDEYEKKFAEMQKYVPFVEAMIQRLQNNPVEKDRENREMKLQKMQSLHEILTNNERKMKIGTLERCKNVLQKLYNKNHLQQ